MVFNMGLHFPVITPTFTQEADEAMRRRAENFSEQRAMVATVEFQKSLDIGTIKEKDIPPSEKSAILASIATFRHNVKYMAFASFMQGAISHWQYTIGDKSELSDDIFGSIVHPQFVPAQRVFCNLNLMSIDLPGHVVAIMGSLEDAEEWGTTWIPPQTNQADNGIESPPTNQDGYWYVVQMDDPSLDYTVACEFQITAAPLD